MNLFVNLSELSGILRKIGDLVNKNNDEILDYDEICIFNKAKNTYNPNDRTCKIGDMLCNIDGGNMYTLDNYNGSYVFNTDEEQVLAKMEQIEKEGQDIKNRIKTMIKDEVLYYKTNKHNGHTKFDGDLDYWANIIFDFSQKYEFPPEVIIALLSTESWGNFSKNVNSVNGRGPAQITTMAVKSFFPNTNGSWFKFYSEFNNDLLQEILYDIGDDGEKTLRYNSPKDLRNACSEDDAYGIKVGMLHFKMKYIAAISVMKYGRVNGQICAKYVKKVIKSLRSGELTLTESEKKEALRRCFAMYNAAATPQKYANRAMKSLDRMGYDFTSKIV